MIKIGEYYVYEWFVKETNEVFYVGKGKGDRYKVLRGRNKFFNDFYSSHNCDVRIKYDNLEEKEAFEKEKELISFYRNNTRFRLTNVTDGGDGTSGFKHTDESKKILSAFSKERWDNEEFRNKMIKIRRDENGPYKSKKFRDKMRKLSLAEKNPNYGNYWSDEKRRKLSNYFCLNRNFNESNNPNSKKVICLEDGKKFDTINEAAREYNIKCPSSISISLKNKNRVAGDRHWRLYDKSLENEEIRFTELLISLSKSEKFPIMCEQTKETFNTRKSFLRSKNIKIKRFLNNYNKNGYYEHEKYKYMYVKDYLSRYM